MAIKVSDMVRSSGIEVGEYIKVQDSESLEPVFRSDGMEFIKSGAIIYGPEELAGYSQDIIQGFPNVDLPSTTRILPDSTHFVAYCNNRYFFGEGRSIYHSESIEGPWISVTLPVTDAIVRDIVYYKGVYVTIGNRIHTSTDLETWVAGRSGNFFAYTTTHENLIIVGGGSGTSSGIIVISNDGINFTTASPNAPSSSTFDSVASSPDGNKVFAFARNRGISISLDGGATWTFNSNAFPNGNLYAGLIIYHNSKLFLTPFSSLQRNILTSTDDGQTWSIHATPERVLATGATSYVFCDDYYYIISGATMVRTSDFTRLDVVSEMSIAYSSIALDDSKKLILNALGGTRPRILMNPIYYIGNKTRAMSESAISCMRIK